MKRFFLLLCAIGLTVPLVASADEKPPAAPSTEVKDARGEGHDVFGLETHPYVGLLATRPSGNDSLATWNVGLTVGVDVDFDPFWVGVSYDLYDVLDEQGSYPFDGAFAVHLGLYRGDSVGKLFNVPTEPYAAITLTRPSGPDEWSTGFEAGVEFLLEPLYIGAEYELQDILTNDQDEVYPFDGTFSLQIGAYW